MSGRVWLIGVLVAVVAVLGLFGYGLARQSGVAGVAINNVGQAGVITQKQAPDFRLTLVDGSPFALSAQRGKVVVLNFWASWCPPCRAEAPAFERVWRSSDREKVAFVGVATWDSESAVRTFAAQYGLTYPNARDGTGDVVVDYGVTGVPETFVIGPDGQISRRWIGPLDEGKLRQLIVEAMETKS